MATRLYLSNAANTYTPATVRGTWVVSSSTLTRDLGAKAGAAADKNTLYAQNVTNRDELIGRWVSEPLTAAVTITGSVSWIYIGRHSASIAPTLNSKTHLYVTAGDSDTVRGTLLGNRVGLDAYTATATGRGDGTVAVTSVSAQVGDRIVLEVGFRATTAPTAGSFAYLTYGGADATDRGEGDTTAGRPGWVEFTSDLLFIDPVVEKSGSDSVTVSVGESTALLRDRPVTDTATVGITETAALNKVVPKDVTDTVSVTVTESVFIGSPVEKAGSDSVTVAAADAAAVSKPLDRPPVSDTVTVSVVAAATRTTVSRAFTAADTASVSVIEVAVVRRDVFGADSITVAIIDSAVRHTVGPMVGTRVSPPKAILDGPIAGSRIYWTATTPGGSAVHVESSVDAGATWQTVDNGGPVPRLVQGDIRTARTVITRATLTRAAPEDPTPRLHRIVVDVDVDSSVEELCPVGVFTLNDVEIEDSSRGVSIELAGADLSRRVARNRWDDTYVVVEGTNVGTAIQDMIRNRMPDAAFNFASTARTTPRLFYGEQASNDPWQDAQDLAVSIGYELYFDARGICTLRPEPDPEVGDPVWEFEDTAQPTIVELRRRVTDENTYNKVIVTGEGSSLDVPVRAVALDSDPASPTYYLGPYGTVTFRITNSLVLTAEQAQDAADALLRRVKGATEAVELTVVPMPALEPGDIVEVTRDRTKVAGRFLLDQIRIPLGADEAMRAVGRRQRL